jgi:hypothetical protein
VQTGFSSEGLSAQAREMKHDKKPAVMAVRTFLFMIPPKNNLASGNIEKKPRNQYFIYVTNKIIKKAKMLVWI